MSKDLDSLLDIINKLANDTNIRTIIKSAVPSDKLKTIAEDLYNITSEAASVGISKTTDIAKEVKAKLSDKDDLEKVYSRLAVLAAQSEENIRDLATKHNINPKALGLALRNTSSTITDFVVDNMTEIVRTIDAASVSYKADIKTTITGMSQLATLFEKSIADRLNKQYIQQDFDAFLEQSAGTLSDNIFDEAAAIILKKPIKPIAKTTTKTTKLKSNKVSTGRKVDKANKLKSRKTVHGKSVPDALSLKNLINSLIYARLANPSYGFMMSKTMPSNPMYLRFQTGRFASQVKVLSVRNTIPGDAIAIKYANAGYPYDPVYLPGGKLYTQKGRDIKHIAEGVIRQLAIEALSKKFKGIRINIGVAK